MAKKKAAVKKAAVKKPAKKKASKNPPSPHCAVAEQLVQALRAAGHEPANLQRCSGFAEVVLSEVEPNGVLCIDNSRIEFPEMATASKHGKRTRVQELPRLPFRLDDPDCSKQVAEALVARHQIVIPDDWLYKEW